MAPRPPSPVAVSGEAVLFRGAIAGLIEDGPPAATLFVEPEDAADQGVPPWSPEEVAAMAEGLRALGFRVGFEPWPGRRGL